MSADGYVQSDANPFSESGNSADPDAFRYDARFPEYGGFVVRLKSFEASQWNRVAKRQLAAAGFFNPGRPSTVQCFYCGLRMAYQWTGSNDPWRDHAWHVTDDGCDYLDHMKDRVFVQSGGLETGEAGAASCFDRNGCGANGWIPCGAMNNCRLCVWEFLMTPPEDEDSD